MANIITCQESYFGNGNFIKPEIKKTKKQKNKEICIREINSNIQRVFNNNALTKSLKFLNDNCDFKERYKIACELKDKTIEEDAIKKRKEYNNRPEVKERIKKKRKKYRDKPEVKNRKRKYDKNRYNKLRGNSK